MNTIYKSMNLLSLGITKYKVVPMKNHSILFTAYQCEPGEENHFGVLAVYNDLDIRIASFKEQDKAHQFAELLTECLTKIKAFTDENTETK